MKIVNQYHIILKMGLVITSMKEGIKQLLVMALEFQKKE